MDDKEQINAVYKKMVDDYLENDSSIVFGNITIAHAQYVIQRLFKSAQKNIKILSGTCAEFFYDKISSDFKAAALDLADRQGNIKIITCDEDCGKFVDSFEAINEEVKGKGKPPVIDYTPAIYKGDRNKLRHFIVVDDKRYRLESPHEVLKENNVTEIKAEVCFNGGEIAKGLSSQFDVIYKNLTNPAKPQPA